MTATKTMMIKAYYLLGGIALIILRIPRYNRLGKVKNSRKVGINMDIARISSKGQVTIPIEIRKKLGLKEGDKVIFLEKDNNVILINSNRFAFEELQREMAGEVEKAGIKNERDVVDLVKEVRQKIWEERYEGNA